MSRVGKEPITVPKGVTVTISDENLVTVKGPKGTLSQQVQSDFTIKEQDGHLIIERPSNAKPHKAKHGLYRSLVNNLVVGVTEGYERCWKLWAQATAHRWR